MDNNLASVSEEGLNAVSGGCVDLSFARDPNGQTYIQKQFTTYPFHVCRPLYIDKFDPNIATLYLQSCSGGIFENDKLHINLIGAKDSQVHVTTQASTIVHQMETGTAHQTIKITGEKGALIEYIPNNNILFPEAKLCASTEIIRDHDCHVLVSDSFFSYDPDNQGGVFDQVDNELIIKQPNGKIDFTDRFSISGTSFKTGETPLSNNYKIHGTYALLTDCLKQAQFIKKTRSLIEKAHNIYAGVSHLPNDSGCWVRYLAIDGTSAATFLTSIWMISREIITGNAPNIRRK